jgi:phospholipid-transporting ATPase
MLMQLLQMDPFFDDDDLDVPDSAFGGNSAAMHSTDTGLSKLPLSSNAATFAGAGASKSTLATFDNAGSSGKPWTFDDDDGPRMSGMPYSDSGAGANPYGNGGSGSSLRTVKRKRARMKWKWPWAKEKVLAGERVVPLNSESTGTPDAEPFCSNYVSTSKYNIATFVPKFLAGASIVRAGVTQHFSRKLTGGIQNNSANTPICFSYSPLSYNRYLVYHLQISRHFTLWTRFLY